MTVIKVQCQGLVQSKGRTEALLRKEGIVDAKAPVLHTQSLGSGAGAALSNAASQRNMEYDDGIGARLCLLF